VWACFKGKKEMEDGRRFCPFLTVSREFFPILGLFVRFHAFWANWVFTETQPGKE
jgi:hypothetical protein